MVKDSEMFICPEGSEFSLMDLPSSAFHAFVAFELFLTKSEIMFFNVSAVSSGDIGKDMISHQV